MIVKADDSDDDGVLGRVRFRITVLGRFRIRIRFRVRARASARPSTGRTQRGG